MYCINCGKHINNNSNYCLYCGKKVKYNNNFQNITPRDNNNNNNNINYRIVDLLCCLFGGFFGLHYFIHKKFGMGFLYLFTFGLFGIGWIVDIIKAVININKPYVCYDNNDNFNKNKIISQMDYGMVISLQRDGNFRKSSKRYLVQVTSHGDSCLICKKWEKKILIDDLFSNGKPDGIHILLSEAVKSGLFHNGCRHGLTTYYPELENINHNEDLKYLEKREITITSHSTSIENPYKYAVPGSAFANAYIDRKSKDIPENYVVFDTETTGLEPEIDKIIEISAIKYINNEQVDKFSCLINPNTNLDPFITKLTGIKQSDLINKPTINQVLPSFFKFIEDYTLVAHNAPFDIKMLACECYRNNIKLCDNKIIDTITLAKRIIPKEKVGNYKLETLKNYLGLTYNSHRALDDCETCAKIYQLYLAKNSKKKIIMIDENTGEVLDEIN